MFLWNVCIWRQQQTIFFQARDGLLDLETGTEQSSIVRTLMQHVSSRRFWDIQKGSLDTRFVDWVDGVVGELPAASGK